MDICRALRPSPFAVNFLGLEDIDPPVPRSRVEEVSPRATTWPAPSFVFSFAGARFDKNTKFRRLFESGIIIVSLQVRVDDDNHLKESQSSYS